MYLYLYVNLMFFFFYTETILKYVIKYLIVSVTHNFVVLRAATQITRRRALKLLSIHYAFYPI